MTIFEDAGDYDALYREKDYGAECDLIERASAPYRAGDAKRLLDVGCGTGSHSIELARRGYRVTGVDLTPAMLEMARAKAAKRFEPAQAPTFLQGDARSFRVDGERFDVAVMMFAVLCYMNSNDDVIRALTNIRSHLKPGGVFVCDFWWGPAVLSMRPQSLVRVVPAGNGKLLRATRTTLDTLACTADVHFDMFRFEPGVDTVETTEVHRLRYFFGPEIELLFKCAGLKLQKLGQLRDFDLAPDDVNRNTLAVATAI